MKQMLKKNMLRTAICSHDVQMLKTLGNYFLECGGFEKCDVYRSGREILRELQNGRCFDVIVLDEQMQDMDALHLLGEIQKIRMNPKPLTIVMSAHAFISRMDHSSTSNMDLCVAKPFRAGVLAHRIRSYFAEHSEAVHTYCQQLCCAFGVQDDTTNSMYLADAELLAWQSEAKLAIRKEIVMQVSEAHGVSVNSVDSGLRRLIERMETANTDAYNRFKQETGLSGEKPTIGRLIYAVKRYAASHAEGDQ